MKTTKHNWRAYYAKARTQVMLHIAVYCLLIQKSDHGRTCARSRVLNLRTGDYVGSVDELWQVMKHTRSGVYVRRIYKTRRPGKTLRKLFSYTTHWTCCERPYWVPGADGREHHNGSVWA